MIACPITYGEAVTTVPSNRDHVFALGRQDMLFFTKSLNPVIRSADLRVAPFRQSPDSGP